MTREEKHLWYDFLKTYPIQFRRQVPVGYYYLDFYCYRAKLAIELDGSQHYEPEAMQKDQNRTAFLATQGIAVLRFSNLDIMKNFPGVCETIINTVNKRIEG